MKINSMLLMTSALLACSLLQACGGSSKYDSMTSTPTGPQSQTLDTPQVQVLTQSSTETTDPMPVNDGLVTMAGSSDDSSDPVMVSSP